MSNTVQVLKRDKSDTCLHLYNPETDGAACNSRIKRENWELVEMDYDEWREADWRCWACPWRLDQAEGEQAEGQT